MSTQPIYITMSHIAKTLGYAPSNINHLITKWHNDPDLPTPPPDAHLIGNKTTPTPLWLQEHLPKWETWNQQRITLSHERAAHSPTIGRPAAPGKRTTHQ